MKTTNPIHGPAAPVTNTIHHPSSVNVTPIIGHHLCPLCHLLCHQLHVHILSKQKLQCHQLRRRWAHRFLINLAVSDALEILKRPFRLELKNRQSHTIEAAVIREAAAGPVRHQDGVAAALILGPGHVHGHRLDDVVADPIHGPDLVRVARIHVIADVGEVEPIIGQGKSEYTFPNVDIIYVQLTSLKSSFLSFLYLIQYISTQGLSTTTVVVALLAVAFETISVIVAAAVVSDGPVHGTTDSAAEIDLIGVRDLVVGALTAQNGEETAPRTIVTASAANAKHRHHPQCPTMAITTNQ